MLFEIDESSLPHGKACLTELTGILSMSILKSRQNTIASEKLIKTPPIH